MGALPRGRPGWPELAFWIASAAKTLIELTDSASIAFMSLPPKNCACFYICFIDVRVKSFLTPLMSDCSALCAPAILKTLKSAHFSMKNGCFSVFWRVSSSNILPQAGFRRIYRPFDPAIILILSLSLPRSRPRSGNFHGFSPSAHRKRKNRTGPGISDGRPGCIPCTIPHYTG